MIQVPRLNDETDIDQHLALLYQNFNVIEELSKSGCSIISPSTLCPPVRYARTKLGGASTGGGAPTGGTNWGVGGTNGKDPVNPYMLITLGCKYESPYENIRNP